MYHLYINTPDGAIGNCKPSQLIRAAIMQPSEYSRIKSHMCWTKMQEWEANQRNERIRKFKECSQNIVKTWHNTLLNKQLEREEKRRKRLESMENYKNSMYEKSLVEKEHERRKKLEEVRNYFLLDRDDIRAINSAYVFSEVLRERQAQLKYKEKTRAKELKMKEEYDNRVKEDVECFLRTQKDAKGDDHKAKLKRRKELIEQMRAQKEKYEGALLKEKEMEKEDLLLMKEEMKLIEENMREEDERKKAICREDAEESRRYEEERKKLHKLIEEDQNKAIEIYLKYKRRIDCLIQKEIERSRKELHDKQEAITNKIYQQIKAAEEHHQRLELHQAAQKEAGAAEELKQKQEKVERLRRERQENHLALAQRKEQKEKFEKEMKEWEFALGLKKREVDKIRELREKQDKWAIQMETRKGYNAQIQEKLQKLDAEKQEAMRELCHILYDESMVHEAFFKFAKKYLDKVRANGGNDYPIIKEVENYRKRNGFSYVQQQERRRKADEERWKDLSGGDPNADDLGLESALTVWQPQRECPLTCGDNKVPEGNVCVSPNASLNLPRIRSSDICGLLRREILMREAAEKGTDIK